MSGRTHFTSKEDAHLVEYIARARPQPAGRLGNEIYKTLVENPDKWPWARTRSWQSWRERYKSNKAEFDWKIAAYQREQNIDSGEVDMDREGKPRQRAFTEDEDRLLIKYLAKYNPQMRGRNGNFTYKRLVENPEGKWNWSKTRSWQSWRHRYVSNQEDFDRRIKRYQERHNIQIPPTPKRGAIESRSERPAKRQKIEEQDSQEERWAKINWPTPRQSHVPDRSENRSNGQEREGKVPVGEEPKRNESRGARTAVRGDQSDSSQSGDDSSDGKPPGSEDYHGEIFQEPDQDENAGSGRSGTSEADAGDQGNGGDNGQDQNVAEAPPNGYLDTIKQEEPSPPDVSAPLEPAQAVGTERSSQKSPPKAPPPKIRVGASHNDFTLVPRSQRRQNDDPFEDFQSSPDNERKATMARKRPPTLIEGAYGNRLNGTQSRKVQHSSTEESDDDDAQSLWPPRRAMVRPHVTPLGQDGNKDMKEEKTKVVEDQAAERRRREKGKGKAINDDEPVVDSPASNQDPNIRRLSKLRPLQGTQDTPEAGPSRTTILKRRQTDIFAPTPPPETLTAKRYSTGDIVDSTHKNIIPTTRNQPNSRTINLRQELANKHLHQPVRRSSSRASHISSVISEEDSYILQELGIRQAIRMLSDEFGFTETVVQKLWNELMSLRLLKDALSEMRNSADRTMGQWLEGVSMVSKNSSPSRSVLKSKTQSPVAANIPVSATNLSVSSPRHQRRKSSVSGKGKGLEIKPVDIRDVSAAMELEYEPLSGTRAGKYARLAKMGREDEALEREQRRVSTIALSPRRDLLQQQQEQEQERRQPEAEGEHEGADDDEGVDGDVELELQNEDDDKEGQNEEAIDDLPVDDVMKEAHGVDQRGTMGIDPPSSHSRSHGTERSHREHHDRASEREDNIEKKVNGEPPIADKDGNQGLQTLGDDEEAISIKSESPDDAEVAAMVQSDAERWKEVEHLFLAANRHNVEMLREVEKTFDPGFLMHWLGNEFVLK